MATPSPVRFGVIGLNHPHIFEITQFLLTAGADLAGFHSDDDDLAATFREQFPQAQRTTELNRLLEDPAIHLIASAAVSSERGPLGIAAMQHGKDFLSDKPAFTQLEDLEHARRVQRQTGRIYGIDYGERLRNRAMVKASALVQAGAIGRVLQTVGLGPHRHAAHKRPAWFYERERYGGILTDIGAHQADHFLHFTGSTAFEVVASQVGNLAHPETPEFEDFGDALVRGNNGTGYFRVDWFTPAGLASWGDGRVTILGTDGFIEVRKNIDIAGRPGPAHLFFVDQRTTEYVDCTQVDLPYGRLLLEDIRNRTETAMSQAHAFLAAELALRAELQAQRVTSAPLAAVAAAR
ncbi:MAG TPA: Gfo/Idh/MocA family oxidoreductase [Chloroflexota bacterium]|nr:Gfo/Idh/MocA family oxidoreductase [Chloroflexota bacterium]